MFCHFPFNYTKNIYFKIKQIFIYLNFYWSTDSQSFLLCNKVNQLYIFVYPLFYRLFSHIGHYKVLSRLPRAIQQVLVSYLFYIQWCVYVCPNLPIYPSPSYPLLAICVHSISATLLLFCKQAHLYLFLFVFRFHIFFFLILLLTNSKIINLGQNVLYLI